MITWNGFSLNNGGSTLIPKTPFSVTQYRFKPVWSATHGTIFDPLNHNISDGPFEDFPGAYVIYPDGNTAALTIREGSLEPRDYTEFEISGNGTMGIYIPRNEIEAAKATKSAAESAFYYNSRDNEWDYVQEIYSLDCYGNSGVFITANNLQRLDPTFANSGNLVTFGGSFPSLTSRIEPIITALTAAGVSAINFQEPQGPWNNLGAFRDSTGAQDYAHCLTAYPEWFNTAKQDFFPTWYN